MKILTEKTGAKERTEIKAAIDSSAVVTNGLIMIRIDVGFGVITTIKILPEDVANMAGLFALKHNNKI